MFSFYSSIDMDPITYRFENGVFHWLRTCWRKTIGWNGAILQRLKNGLRTIPLSKYLYSLYHFYALFSVYWLDFIQLDCLVGLSSYKFFGRKQIYVHTMLDSMSSMSFCVYHYTSDVQVATRYRIYETKQNKTKYDLHLILLNRIKE